LAASVLDLVSGVTDGSADSLAPAATHLPKMASLSCKGRTREPA